MSVVIKGGRFPGSLRMAILTGGGELCRDVVWISTLVIFIRMAAKTGVGRAVVIARMTGIAVFCNQGMGPGQQVIFIVYREACGFPFGLGGMA